MQPVGYTPWFSTDARVVAATDNYHKKTITTNITTSVVYYATSNATTNILALCAVVSIATTAIGHTECVYQYVCKFTIPVTKRRFINVLFSHGISLASTAITATSPSIQQLWLFT